jgi:hypothetical protein
MCMGSGPALKGDPGTTAEFFRTLLVGFSDMRDGPPRFVCAESGGVMGHKIVFDQRRNRGPRDGWGSRYCLTRVARRPGRPWASNGRCQKEFLLRQLIAAECLLHRDPANAHRCHNSRFATDHPSLRIRWR